jgi:FkbM family methyltransferase
MNLKRRLKKLIPLEYTYKVLHLKKSIPIIGKPYHKSYSGNGEDIVLCEYLFAGKRNGFFVDIGAFHPKIISNTYRLSKRGWRGINIDPNPQAIKLFDRYRKKDINLRLGISDSEEKKTYYNFAFSGANTFDEEFAQQKMKKKWNKLISKDQVQCLPLKSILEKHAPETHIDLLDVDVEGHDLNVLKSNDWEKFRPSVVLVEDKKFRYSPGTSEIYKYLEEKGYRFHSYMDITLIMTDAHFKPNEKIKAESQQ